MAKLTISKRFEKMAKATLNDGIQKRIRAAINEGTPQVRDYIKRTFMGAASRGGPRLARNTGQMERRTVATPAVIGPTGSISAGIEIRVPYASTHFAHDNRPGITIYPRSKAALTVPILENSKLRPPKPATEYPRRFAHRGVLYSPTARGVLPIFRLRKSVYVETRVHIAKDIQPTARKILRNILLDRLLEEFAK